MASTHIIEEAREDNDGCDGRKLYFYLQHSRNSLHKLEDMIMMDEDGRACYYLKHQQRRS